MVKEIITMDIFLMNNIYIYKMFGIHLMLILLKIFLIIIWKKHVLLADVYEKVISTCLKYYGLDPCHYFSEPGLSWDAMLKMTKVELEEISDPDKYMFLKKEWEVELVISIKDIVKQIMNIVKIMIKKNLKIILSTLTWIIYMDMQWVNTYQIADLNGLK